MMTPEKRACETYSRVVAANPQTRAADVAMWAEAIAAAERAAYLRGAEEVRGRCAEYVVSLKALYILSDEQGGADGRTFYDLAAALRALPPEPPASPA